MSKKCKCMGCQEGLEAIRERHRQSMAEVGWYAHMITSDDPQTPTGYNYHTHGLTVTFNCLDMQIVFPIEPQVAHSIMETIVEKIRNGHRFRVGEEVDGILQGYKVTFGMAEEGHRDVLRVILPDKDGYLSKDKMQEVFSEQWVGCKN